jgi:hypothetical protein
MLSTVSTTAPPRGNQPSTSAPARSGGGSGVSSHDPRAGGIHRAVDVVCRVWQRQPDRDGSSRTFAATNHDPATVLLHDLTGTRQADARPTERTLRCVAPDADERAQR